jgi:hypothetical protein
MWCKIIHYLKNEREFLPLKKMFLFEFFITYSYVLVTLDLWDLTSSC